MPREGAPSADEHVVPPSVVCLNAPWWPHLRWLGLADEQERGLACVVCGRSMRRPGPGPRVWVPVGDSERSSHVFACVGACAGVAAAHAGSDGFWEADG